MAPFAMHLLCAGAGAILTAQGVIVGERQDGTATWVLAKPVSRATWLPAKAASLLGGFVAALLVVSLAATTVLLTLGTTAFALGVAAWRFGRLDL